MTDEHERENEEAAALEAAIEEALDALRAQDAWTIAENF